MISGSFEYRWPFAGAALVVDDNDLCRHAVVTLLRETGCPCEGAGTYHDAYRSINDDRRIRTVLLDHTMAGANLGAVVRQMRTLRSDLIIVGNSGSDARAEFRAAGIDHFLRKPWSISDLLGLLMVPPITRCEHCGLRLPIHRPLRGEIATQWVCKGCGAWHCGVLDNKPSAADLANIRRNGPR